MNIQLNIKIGLQSHKVFLPTDFHLPTTPSKYLHQHKYPEIHLIAGGGATFNINNSLYSVADGSVLVIPPDIFHCYLDKDDSAQRAAFQFDCKIKKFALYNISPDTIKDFFLEIEKCEHTNDYTRLSAYITLFCSYVYPKKEFSAQPLEDYVFLINEFFSRRYNEDLHLCDLADALHLSERQVERLVIEHTGKPFREALVATRINIAKQLLKSTDMPLTEIAGYVGYRSYAGFWKIMKKYNL